MTPEQPGPRGPVQSNGEVFHGRPAHRLLQSAHRNTSSSRQGCVMRRREFVGLIGGAAAWPLAARAQQPRLPVIGYLSAGTGPLPNPEWRKGLSEMGFVEGHNVSVEARFAQNDYDRFPDLAADLVRRRVAVIVMLGSMPAALAAKVATATIPIEQTPSRP